MHPVARALALAYVTLAVFAVVVYAQTSVNYVQVSEVVLNLEENVRVSEVDLGWTGDPADPAVVHVHIEVTNPGRIPMEVINVEFQLYMDDPNDLRAWYDSGKLEQTRIRPGGFNQPRGQGFVIAPGETQTLVSNLTIEPGTVQMDRLDKPDLDGRYHPIVWLPRLTYTFTDFDLTRAVFLAPYYDPMGVLPSG